MSSLDSISIASAIPFCDFCMRCEKLQSLSRTKKFDYLRNYIKYFRRFAQDFKGKNPTADVSFFPIMRLLIPDADRERGTYGIKEYTLANILIKILSISKEGEDAKKLLNYKAPSDSTSRADFADIVYLVVKLRCPEKGTLTVEQVNNHLCNMSFKHVIEKKPVDDELILMLRAMTALEVKWLTRLILKDMHLGIAQTIVLKLFHVDASDLFDSCCSLRKVCSTLHNPLDRLHKLDISLFLSVSPMLSERLDIARIHNALKKSPDFILETKFDGERFQIHMQDGKFKYFSRNGYDFTDQFGASANEGILTPKIAPLLKATVKNFIMDGEMMGWDKKKKSFGSKGMHFDVKKLTIDATHQPCFCAFDLLYKDNEILTDKPLAERVKLLDELFKDRQGIIIHSKRTKAKAVEDVLNALNAVIDKGDEGLVMKATNSVYKPNNRKGGWYKIKPEYTDGVLLEMDFLIIGGYYGEVKGKGLITSFLLGVAKDLEEPETETFPKMFLSVARVGIGFTAEELTELNRTLGPHWKTTPVRGKRSNRRIIECPTNLAWGKEVPDVWIEPKNSCCLQVKATELAVTKSFKTEFTLRFPRVVKVRYDKPWYSCMTLGEFCFLTKDSDTVKKLSVRHINSNDIDSASDSEPEASTSTGSPYKYMKLGPTPFTFTLDAKKIKVISNILDGKEFCVLSATSKLSKPSIEKKIIENGGTIVQNPGPDTYCSLFGKTTTRVRNFAACARYDNPDSIDVVCVSWLLRCIETSKFVPYRMQELLAGIEFTRDEMYLLYDSYGDSYAEDTDVDVLRRALAKVDDWHHNIIPTEQELQAMDQGLFTDANSPYSPLRDVVLHLLVPPIDKSAIDSMNTNYYYWKSIRVEITKTNLKLLGAQLLEVPDGSLTHVLTLFVDWENEEAEKKYIDQQVSSLKSQMPDLKIVTEDWVNECLEKHCCVNI